MALMFAPIGKEVTISSIKAEDKVKKHLTELGVCEGENVTLLSSQGGNVIVVVKEGRLCLDRVLSSKILVTCA